MAQLNALYAFDSLVSSLLKTPPAVKFTSAESSPLFVTWHKERHGERQLRGCIGSFAPLNLERGIKQYALIAAFEDTRFSPIRKSELPLLSVDVTILRNFEPVDDPLDWELGKHGVRVRISSGARDYGATFLPDVALEQGWSKEETLEHCVQKSGFPFFFEIKDIKVTRYEGIKSGYTYEEYKAYIS